MFWKALQCGAVACGECGMRPLFKEVWHSGEIAILGDRNWPKLRFFRESRFLRCSGILGLLGPFEGWFSMKRAHFGHFFGLEGSIFVDFSISRAENRQISAIFRKKSPKNRPKIKNGQKRDTYSQKLGNLGPISDENEDLTNEAF